MPLLVMSLLNESWNINKGYLVSSTDINENEFLIFNTLFFTNKYCKKKKYIK
jgi:hypothetical protein